MAKKSIFSCLYLNRDNILPDIKEFCSQEFKDFKTSGLELVNEGNHQYRCTIIGDNKKVLVDFYYRDDNTTTIQPKVGEQTDISMKLALYIRSKVQTTDVKGSSYSIKAEEETFQLVLEFFDGLDDVELIYQDITNQNGYVIYQYQSKIGDRLTLKYFTNHTLQVQGKPLYLYQELTCLLSEYYPFEQAVKNQQEFFSVPIDPLEIRSEIQQFLPEAHKILGETLIKVLTPSITYMKIDIDLPDYSSFAVPALRTLEGYLRYLFSSKNYTIGENFGMFNEDHVTGLYYLGPKTRAKVGCAKTCNAMEKVYTYYNQHRHGLSHTENIAASTRIITDKNDAHKIILEVINMIETTYLDIIAS